jgi:hypothetical protein
MKSKPFYLICFQLFAITESLVEKNPTRKSVYGRNNHHQASLLSAIPTSSSYRNSGGSVPPSNTACESAVNVEWEPMSNLQRRIEDGVNYEHIPSAANHHDESQRHTRMPGCHSKAKRITENEDDDSPGVRAVFCGYKYTQDDYNRLKAADVA